jgi:hypothetical protein
VLVLANRMLKKTGNRLLENHPLLLPRGEEVSTRVSRRQAWAPAPQSDVILIPARRLIHL